MTILTSWRNSKRRRRIDQNLQRKFTCNWAVAIIVGLIGIPMKFIPTILAVLYVISAYTPEYRINKRLVQGKHFNEFASVAGMFGDNPGIVGVLFMYALIIAFMPFVVAINFYRNWISVPSAKTSAGYVSDAATTARDKIGPGRGGK